jgi:hypothetical protein
VSEAYRRRLDNPKRALNQLRLRHSGNPKSFYEIGGLREGRDVRKRKKKKWHACAYDRAVASSLVFRVERTRML